MLRFNWPPCAGNPECPKRIWLKRIGTSQQQISRLESPSYEGHSLSMLRKVAEVLGANVQVKIERAKTLKHSAVAERMSRYGKKSN